MLFLTELNDVWVLHDGKMVAEGDAKAIDPLLEAKLVELKKGSWTILYRHRDTEELWDLVYRLDHRDPEKWDPYPN